MKGYIYITQTGYDPEKGKDIKDPFLGSYTTLGACMTNIRRHVVIGDHIFLVTGKVGSHQQFVLADIEVAEKIDAVAAYDRFPELRLDKTSDGIIRGNVIVLPDGTQHPLDHHSPKSFKERIKNYIVGRNALVLRLPEEISRGRAETVDALRRIMGKDGKRPIDIIGRCSRLDENQVMQMNNWLQAIKQGAPTPPRSRDLQQGAL